MANCPQFDLPAAGSVFNLAGEAGEDPSRLAREAAAAEQARRAAAEYQARMQLTLERCPGFTGCDCPSGPGRLGRVVIDPRLAPDAVRWLKRRFRVAESIELSTGDNLVMDIITKRSSGAARRLSRHHAARFGKVEQFELAL